METWKLVIIYSYFAVMLALSIYGAHRYFLVFLYYRHKKNRPQARKRFETLPKITVQLPIFNEACVVSRLIDSVCNLEYPKDRLGIQVLDDSTDETRILAESKVEEKAAQGYDIQYIHREDRKGFKAGALKNGLRFTDSEFIAIFDADFVPKPDVFNEIIHHFTNREVGMVQVRWGHINRKFSLLTRLQSIFLDGHFVIEHAARNWSGRFFNFNGTAGIWRRRCIEEAGGWQSNTLTEDLDLSYRAQMKGWRFVFVSNVEAPAELPIEMAAFKSQQHRWAKGSIQTARKNLKDIWQGDIPFKVKLEATFHLTSNVAYTLMLLVSFLMLPAFWIRIHDPNFARALVFDVTVFMAATTSVLAFYAASQREIYQDWKRQLICFPLLLALGIGLTVNNSRAVIEALFGKDVTFIRTPKYNADRKKGKKSFLKRYKGNRNIWSLLELALGMQFTFITGLAFYHSLWLPGFFLSLFMIGFYWVGISSLLPAKVQPSLLTRELGSGIKA
ncbi:MAG: cellulose synthase family protein [Planctomycetota bacterium]|jgi:cellulose synthase/poly-beta-1,6-N-acetylglucosamine synthase-like glycosyltransferase